jgi:hypothetical protein
MTYQAIETKYYGPTNHRGSRIKAYAQCGKVWVHYDHGLSTQENHASAAMAFLRQWEWEGSWVQGANAANTGYVFVQAERTQKGPMIRGFARFPLTDEF